MTKNIWFRNRLILIIAILGGLLVLSLLAQDKIPSPLLPAKPIVIEKTIYQFYPDAKTKYVYTPFPESWEIADNLTLAEFPLSQEQTIKSSLDGAGYHLY